MISFANPCFLLFVLLAPLSLFYYFKKYQKERASIRYSDLGLLKNLKPTKRLKQRHIPIFLRSVVILLLAIALARPQSGTKSTEITSEGIDIILVLDISGSMRAEDFKPYNRLYVAKEVIKDFIKGRQTDRVGLVVFSKQAFTQCPLTLDYDVLLKLLDQVDFGMIEDGTAIGMAIATGVNRLEQTKAKSKVMVLLTDGINNSGEIDPATAAEVAKTMGVKIYTIGAGKPGSALYPVQDPIFGKRYIYMENEIDEETLKKIAQLTGGEYFRAKDEKILKRIYQKISELEKTEIKVKEYINYQELFGYFLFLGFGFFLAEIVLANTRYGKIP